MKISLQPYKAKLSIDKESMANADMLNRKCILCRKKIRLVQGFIWSVIN